MCNGKIPKSVAREDLMKITRNVVGFDIDALAILTARTNYVITLAVVGLLEHKSGESIEMPIYMANSIVTVGEMKQKIDLRPYIDREATFSILGRYDLTKVELELVKELYNKLLELEKKGVDKIWIPIIKSYIQSTLFQEQFDYVVGKLLIKDEYGLVVNEHLMTHMEMATLFFVRSIDLYLKNNGLIGFVMPRVLFNADQHHRFRRHEVKDVSYKILKIIDCENKQLRESKTGKNYEMLLKERGCLTPQQVARFREDIRKELKDILKQINKINMASTD